MQDKFSDSDSCHSKWSCASNGPHVNARNCCLCVFKCFLSSLLMQPTGWPVPKELR